jgi:hypothetical protein
MVVLAHIKEKPRLSLGSYGRPRMTEELKRILRSPASKISKSQARDACIAGIKPFLKPSDFQFLTSDDGTRFFFWL